MNFEFSDEQNMLREQAVTKQTPPEPVVDALPEEPPIEALPPEIPPEMAAQLDYEQDYQDLPPDNLPAYPNQPLPQAVGLLAADYSNTQDLDDGHSPTLEEADRRNIVNTHFQASVNGQLDLLAEEYPPYTADQLREGTANSTAAHVELRQPNDTDRYLYDLDFVVRRLPKPLEAVSNWLEKAIVKVNGEWHIRESLIRPFLKNGAKLDLTTRQRDLLLDLREFHARLAPVLEAEILAAEKELPKYRYLDRIKDLLQQDADGQHQVNPNVLAAMTITLHSWLGQTDLTMDLGQMRRFLGLADDEAVPPEDYDKLVNKGIYRAFAIKELGRSAVRMLGLQQRSGPPNVIRELELSIGNHLWAVLSSDATTIKALVETSIVKVKDVAKLDAKTAGYNFIKPDLKRPAVKRARRLHPGSQSLVNRLTGLETPRKDVLEDGPPELSQQRTSTGMEISPEQQQAIQNQANRPWRVNPHMRQLRQLFTRRQLEIMGGAHAPPGRKIRLPWFDIGDKGRTDTIKRELDYLEERDQIDAQYNGSQPFWFTPVVWKQQRVGLEQNTLNPLSSKLHRFNLQMAGWQMTLDPSSEPTEQLEQQKLTAFMLAVGQGLNAKVDRLSLPTAKQKFHKKIQEPAIREALLELQDFHNGRISELTAVQQEKILVAVHGAGKNFRSLAALNEYARWQAHLDLGTSEPFVTTLPMEVDGVTNGPALGRVLMGLLDKDWSGPTGFLFESDGASTYGEWKEIHNGRDAYERFIDELDNTLDPGWIPDAIKEVEKKIENRLYYLTNYQNHENPEKRQLWETWHEFWERYTTTIGPERITALIKAKPRIERANDIIRRLPTVFALKRDSVKTQVTALIFGLGEKKYTQAIGDWYLDNLMEQLEIVLNGGIEGNMPEADRLATVQRVLRQLNKLDLVTMPVPRTLEEAAQLNITYGQLQQWRANFKDAFEPSINEARDRVYGPFMEKRSVANQAGNAAWTRWQVARHTLEHAMEELLLDLDLAPAGTNGSPIEDLPIAIKQTIDSILRPMAPIVQSAWGGEQLNAGLWLGKVREQISVAALDRKKLNALLEQLIANPVDKKAPTLPHRVNSGPYTQQSQFGLDDKGQLRNTAENRIDGPPGVSPVPNWIHSFDSYIMNHVLGQLEYLGMNIHDAFLAAPDQAENIAQAVNEHTARALANNHIGLEMAKMLLRSYANAEQVIEQAEKQLNALLDQELVKLREGESRADYVQRVNALRARAEPAIARAVATLRKRLAAETLQLPEGYPLKMDKHSMFLLISQLSSLDQEKLTAMQQIVSYSQYAYALGGNAAGAEVKATIDQAIADYLEQRQQLWARMQDLGIIPASQIKATIAETIETVVDSEEPVHLDLPDTTDQPKPDTETMTPAQVETGPEPYGALG